MPRNRTGACGLASRENLAHAFKDALAGDPVSAFGGVLICNKNIDLATATEVNKIFCEIVVAPSYDADVLEVLKSKKNRKISMHIERKNYPPKKFSICNSVLLKFLDFASHFTKRIFLKFLDFTKRIFFDSLMNKRTNFDLNYLYLVQVDPF